MNTTVGELMRYLSTLPETTKIEVRARNPSTLPWGRPESTRWIPVGLPESGSRTTQTCQYDPWNKRLRLGECVW
jgi:hypothetical protein